MKIIPSEKAFLGLEKNQGCSYQDARAVIIPFPLEKSVSYQEGTSRGPQAMIEASYELELFDEDFWCEPYQHIGIATLEAPPLKQTVSESLSQLSDITKQVLQDQKFPLIFGGEHSLTAGSIRPFAEKYQDLVIVHFDAHADLRDGYLGEHYSHAAALRRCLDYEHIKLLSFGIRNISAEEIPFYESQQERMHFYWAKDQRSWDLTPALSLIKDKPIYLTFDLDCFDSSIMPATGTPEPGGLFWNDAIDLIKTICAHGNVVGGDINELSPRPGFHACDFLAAKLAYKILSYVFKNKDS